MIRRIAALRPRLTLLAALAGLALGGTHAAAPAAADTLTVPVGRDATWVHIDTGATRRDGRRVGRLDLDPTAIARRCLAQDEDFAGYVRLRPQRRSTGWVVRVECLKRAATDTPAREDDGRA